MCHDEELVEDKKRIKCLAFHCIIDNWPVTCMLSLSLLGSTIVNRDARLRGWISLLVDCILYTIYPVHSSSNPEPFCSPYTAQGSRVDAVFDYQWSVQQIRALSEYIPPAIVLMYACLVSGDSTDWCCYL
ncbi:hypothetical protein I7I50_11224 [Histoplasma capsulatum G186AR]|uniref:Uncharacterized protein n=1 Tax=Ajellomyces capsulatus TaxID=5037 RepID=A0A8H8D7T8_AJECA|nr:hypothetical protein I7I52_02462 [Histoplasma capsulatum]QSS69803.1 hypothetical protein I7I50_11224 [Histoplasma capsulatum G186AR]